MAHEIKQLDKVMLGSSTPAWHGLGTVVSGTKTTAEAIELAGLTWEVDTEPAYMNSGDGYMEVPRSRLIVRKDLERHDTRRVLGQCGIGWKPIQNREAFSIGDALMAEGGAQWETAGSLFNGQKVWMLASVPKTLKVADDKLLPYLLISNPHTGMNAGEALFTTIRVVCNNTLTWALNGTRQRATFHHRGNIKGQIDEARRILGLANDYWERGVATMSALAAAKIDERFVDCYLHALWPNPTKTRDDGSPIRSHAPNIRSEVNRLYHGGQLGSEQEAVRGTAYGLWNATTEFLNRRLTRGTKGGDKVEGRFKRLMFGSDRQTREHAFGLLCRQTGIEDAYVTADATVAAN